MEPRQAELSADENSLAKPGKNDGQNNTDENAGPQGEVKSEIIPLVGEIQGQFSQPGDFGGQQQDHADDYQQDSGDNQKAGDFGHKTSLSTDYADYHKFF
jgi:hypothetical protein